MKSIQLTAIGNALVDVLSRVDEDFLNSLGIQKGRMELVSSAESSEVYRRLTSAREVSGGSAANTVAIFAGLGGKAAFIGKVGNDHHGHVFARDMKDLGVEFGAERLSPGGPVETGRCISMVTPDGERSMMTSLGAARFLTAADVDQSRMKDTEWLFVEGYLLDDEKGREAAKKAISLCSEAHGRIALTLSDPGCVIRNRELIHDLMVAGVIDLLFANRKEMAALFPEMELEAAVLHAAHFDVTAVCTDGPNGVWVGGKPGIFHCPASPADVVDTTGAGDSFAGAFLWGVVSGQPDPVCAWMGCAAAAEVISVLGARPVMDLKTIMDAVTRAGCGEFAP